MHPFEIETIRVLVYHSVSDDSTDEFAINKREFVKHLSTISDANVNVISAYHLVEQLRFGIRPGPHLCITFDDGFTDFLENAAETLMEKQIPATMFVCSDLVGKTERWRNWSASRSFLHWGQLQTLLSLGFTIGSHGHTHNHLSRLPLDVVQSELELSRTELSQRLGAKIDLLAYPFGDQSDAVRRTACESNYRAAFGVGGLWGNRCHHSMFNLNRVVVRRDYSPDLIKRIITGEDDLARARSAGIRIFSGHLSQMASLK